MLVFDEPTLRKLEQLTLVADRVHVGVMKGERRSRKRGSSVEFADYRNYAQGDDLRRLDWNIYARLQRPFIKLLEEEEELAVHLLVDASRSMDWPAEAGPKNKFRYALSVAAALGFVGLVAGDHVTAALLDNSGGQVWGPHRNRHNTMRLLRFLDRGQPKGSTNLNISLKKWALKARRPGLLFLISDMFSPGGYQSGLDALLARGFQVAIIQVLSPDEVEPSIGGDVKLIDIETQADAEITLDAALLKLYRRRLKEWQGEMAAFCSSRNVHYAPIITDQPWDRFILQALRRESLLK